MKTKQIFSKALYPAFFAVMLFASSSVFAQVKIGTNPTVIGAANNLEVEAANNKKVITDKTTGTLKVENKPNSLITDSLVTRSVDGELHQMSQSRLLDQLKIPVTVFSATLTSDYIIPIFAGQDQLSQRIPLTPRSGYSTGWNAATKQFTLPANGFYQVEAGLVCQGTGTVVPGTTLVTRIWSSQDGGGAFLAGVQPIAIGGGDWQSVVWSGDWNAGSTISLNGYTQFGSLNTGRCIIGRLNITKIR
ncbi:hypothetical protein L0657_13740 [Dyadobacter sp. CY345]|uniref:hypothetical protein n=1 Tax=Dyadobacter sp. CY345 TaxID=2909335 RepID=UPI001F3BEC81|nr:hypothetical protein [Dyadobacter sp. CY345]MCF2445024.1 hypothetical protein [Dyadobacter sp. CY345]